MAEVRLENVSKIYNERIKAVDEVSLTDVESQQLFEW
jgi:hypothetical protein